MAQYTLEPAPTRMELNNVARLVLERKKERGYRTQEEIAAVIGVNSSEISRLLNAHIERKWGFSRLSKVANWLGMSIDEILGRADGTTNVLLAGGDKPHPIPLLKADRVIVSRDMVMQIASEIAVERERLDAAVAAEVGSEKAARLRHLIDAYIDRVSALRNRLIS